MTENHLGIITSLRDGQAAGSAIKRAAVVDGNRSAAAKLGKPARDASPRTRS